MAILTKQPEVNIYGKESVTGGWGLIEKEVLPNIMRVVDLTVHYPEECHLNPILLGNDTFSGSQRPKFLCTFATPPALITCVWIEFLYIHGFIIVHRIFLFVILHFTGR